MGIVHKMHDESDCYARRRCRSGAPLSRGGNVAGFNASRPILPFQNGANDAMLHLDLAIPDFEAQPSDHCKVITNAVLATASILRRILGSGVSVHARDPKSVCCPVW